MVWTIPNILTVFRIMAAPCVALAFVLFERPLADWIAFGLFTAAAATDFLDGWLARRWGQVSEIGKMLDPIADKVMVIVALLVLMAHQSTLGFSAGVYFYPILIAAVLIITREILISGVREFLGDVKLPVTQIAKWKTTAQLFAVGVGLLWGPFHHATVEMETRSLGALNNEIVLVAPAEAFMFQMHNWIGGATVVLMWIAALLTIISGWDYLRKALAVLSKREVKG